MTQELSATAVFLLLVVNGCAWGPPRSTALLKNQARGTNQVVAAAKRPPSSDPAPSATVPISTNRTAQVRLVAHEQAAPLPHEHSEPTHPPAVMIHEPETLALADLERLALANNPTLIQAKAQIDGEHGASYQAGLWLNPVVGYQSEQIGVSGTAGETQGGYVSQEFVTGGKLRLSRDKYAQRAQIAATNAYAQQQRVLNDVHRQFYRTLAIQRVVEIHRQLVANGQDNVQTHREMLNLGQTTTSAVLQSEVELRRDQLKLKDAENELQFSWRSLVALAGVPQLPQPTLQGVLTTAQGPLDYDAALAELLASSPELAAAAQKIRHDEIAVERECAEPTPNVLVNAVVGRNFEAGGTTGGVSVGLRLPVFNRNQGTIQQAQADLNRAHAEARRLELELQTRLAAEYRTYRSAWEHVAEYQAEILPKAQEAYELLAQSYKQRRAPWVDVLAAQRLHMTLDIEYVESLKTYHEGDIAIRGMLLTGGLTEPAAAVGGGHIDATPTPR